MLRFFERAGVYEGDKMKNKTLAIVFIVVGVLIVAAVVLAGPLHLTGTFWGVKHILGFILGIVVLAAGLVFFFWKPKNKTRKSR